MKVLGYFFVIELFELVKALLQLGAKEKEKTVH